MQDDNERTILDDLETVMTTPALLQAVCPSCRRLVRWPQLTNGLKPDSKCSYCLEEDTDDAKE